MELYDEKIEERGKRESKISMVLGICISILSIAIIVIICGIVYLKNSMTTIYIDGINKNEIKEIFYIEQTNQESQLYIPIIKMAKHLGYVGYSGDYKEKSEDKNKCHATSKDETVMFTRDSDTVIKIAKNSEYEYIKIDQPVVEKDGELYTTIEGIENGFNVLFSVDESMKNIKIFTLPYLIEYYVANLKISEDGYSTDFNDLKSIMEDILIIKNKENKYGVINVQTKENILECKYDLISYLPTTKDFLVKSNEKYGIVSKDAEIIVRNIYDEIKVMDYLNNLYLVKQNGVYGVLNVDGKVILEPEYKNIGVGQNNYTQNGIENSYVLLNEMIPVQNMDKMWGFFDIKGEKITDFQYTGIGCKKSQVSNSHPVVVIPSYKVVVVEKDERYNLISTTGEELIPSYIVDSVYLKLNTETGQNQYFMTSNNNSKVKNVEEYLVNIGR